MSDFFFRDGDALFEIFDFSSRYDLLFEMAYFLFETSNFLFKGRLFIRDGNFLFEIGDFCSRSASFHLRLKFSFEMEIFIRDCTEFEIG